MNLENPTLELTLAVTIMVSLIVIGIGLRRGIPRKVTCGHCGFKNLNAREFCMQCGEPFKK
jgi:hypothetical protein